MYLFVKKDGELAILENPLEDLKGSFIQVRFDGGGRVEALFSGDWNNYWADVAMPITPKTIVRPGTFYANGRVAPTPERIIDFLSSKMLSGDFAEDVFSEITSTQLLRAIKSRRPNPSWRVTQYGVPVGRTLYSFTFGKAGLTPLGKVESSEFREWWYDTTIENGDTLRLMKAEYVSIMEHPSAPLVGWMYRGVSTEGVKFFAPSLVGEKMIEKLGEVVLVEQLPYAVNGNWEDYPPIWGTYL